MKEHKKQDYPKDTQVLRHTALYESTTEYYLLLEELELYATLRLLSPARANLMGVVSISLAPLYVGHWTRLCLRSQIIDAMQTRKRGGSSLSCLHG